MLTPIQTGLLALHSNRSEALAETVLAWLRQRPLAPLEEEVILVQSNGMAEWLKMTLAREGGVCAATRVELPARFMWRTYRQVLGRDQVPPQSATDKTALTWRLMHLLPQCLAEPGFAPVAGFLKGDDPDRLFQLASRLADLFDQYQVYRADWLDAWEAGRDQLITPGREPQAVPPDQCWQPMLWRALLTTLDEQEMASIRPRLHQRVLDTLHRGAPLAAPVARRVVLFGMTSVPLPTLQTLAALSAHSQVMMAIPNPCRFHWADIMDGRELLRNIGRRRQALRKGLDLASLSLDEMHAHAHPLLASWGRQGRDFVRQLDAFDDAELARERFNMPRLDLFDEDEALDEPLLTQVQHRIRDLVPLNEHPRVAADAADRSIVFHIAHSMLREVEVLHDQLLQLFADTALEGGVQPRDVVVMVPDIDQAAPAIRAVFGQYSRHDARYIPFDIADLSARASSPLVTALTWLLRLPQQRCRLSELRDLLDVPEVAARFGLSPDTLPRLTQWMAGAGIRWGLNDAQRAELGLGACGEQNSAWFGLHRMLLGYACGDATYADIEAYPEVGGLDAELAGTLASLLERLLHWWAVFAQAATPAVWAERGRALLADMAKPLDDTGRQTITSLEEALSAWQSACDDAGFEAEVPLSVAREAWLESLDEPSLNKRFKAGGVTFCTLMPMRAIPFEVVCLLGMNDGDYPRRTTRSDFDLMGLPGQTRPGDRSRRDDDRQLMLEALLSARRMLYVSWTGRNVRDNSEQPPSVLVSQLRDYLVAGWDGDVLGARTTEHPLQPFSRRYFEPDSPLFTHAREWRAAHAVVGEAGSAEAVPPMAAFEPDPKVPLTMAQLTAFLRNPVKAFFRQRLNVVFTDADEDGADEEAFGLDGLEEYGLVRDVVDEVVAQMPHASLESVVADSLARVRRAGHLPLGGLGERMVQQLNGVLLPMLRAWQAEQTAHAEPASRQPLLFEHEGMTLSDWLDQLRHGEAGDGAPVWLALDTGRLCERTKGAPPRADKLLLAWVRSVVAAASGVAVQGVLVGRDATLYVAPMPADEARQTLAMLMSTWRDGLSEPLPVALRTALKQVTGGNPTETYEGGHQNSGENEEPCLRRVYPDFEALVADGRFDELAERVYGQLAQWVGDHVTAQPHPGWDAEATGAERVVQGEGA